MIRFLFIPMRTEEDVALGRYAVQAAHAHRGLVVVLDLTKADGDIVGSELVAELVRTARGNGQVLDILAPAAMTFLPPDSSDHAPAVYDSVEACLVARTQGLGNEDTLALTLPASADYIAPVRRFLVDLVRRTHGEADAFPTEILVDELFLNAVENSPSDRNSYDVLFRCDGGELSMEVSNVFDDTIDSARIMHRRLRSFDASGDYLGERGRGLFLIARLADGLQIQAEPPDRIRVVVTRRLGRTAPPAPVPSASHPDGA